MPPIIGAVIVAALYIATAAEITAGVIATAVVMVAAAAASYALQSKAQAQDFSSLSPQRMVTSRDSIRARDIVYGRIRRGGVVVR